MDKWIKKFSGAVIASVLALTLSSKAYADPPETGSDGGPGTVIESNNPTTASTVIADVKTVSVEDATPDVAQDATPIVAEDPKSAIAQDVTPVVTEDATPVVTEDAAPVITEDAAPVVAEDATPVVTEDATPVVTEDATPVVTGDATPVVTGDATPAIFADAKGFAGSTDMTTPLSLPDATEEETVRNAPEEANDEAKTFVVESEDEDTINLDGSHPVDSIESSGSFDITIITSGLNQIGSISSGGGNVNISGTGIVLIDDYTFVGEHGFILTPINETEVPAVFLRSTEPENKNDYVLINDLSNPGILNEQYVVPVGINLIMPGSTSIELVCPEIENTSVKSDPLSYGQNDITGSSLTIPTGSTLTVSEGAFINMSGTITTPGTVGDYNTGASGVVLTPVLNIQGQISGNGTITGSDHGDGSVGTGIVIINNTANQNESIPSLDSNIFQLKIGEMGLITHNYMNTELLRYFDEYIKNQPIFGEGFGFDTLTAPDPDKPGSYIWNEGFISCFSFIFADNAVKYLYDNENDWAITASECDFSNLTVFRWWLENNAGGGDSIMMTSTSSTGTGLLGGKNAGAISLILKVTDEKSYYNLSAYIEEKQVFELSSKVMVRFDYPVPTATGQLFAVFRNEDGSLTAFPARYDAVTGELVFSGDKLGNFVVISIDYNGKLYTKEFYDYLETIDSVRDLKYGL